MSTDTAFCSIDMKSTYADFNITFHIGKSPSAIIPARHLFFCLGCEIACVISQFHICCQSATSLIIYLSIKTYAHQIRRWWYGHPVDDSFVVSVFQIYRISIQNQWEDSRRNIQSDWLRGDWDDRGIPVGDGIFSSTDPANWYRCNYHCSCNAVSHSLVNICYWPGCFSVTDFYSESNPVLLLHVRPPSRVGERICPP